MTNKERNKSALRLVKVAKELCVQGDTYDLLCKIEDQLKEDIKYDD